MIRRCRTQQLVSDDTSDDDNRLSSYKPSEKSSARVQILQQSPRNKALQRKNGNTSTNKNHRQDSSSKKKFKKLTINSEESSSSESNGPWTSGKSLRALSDYESGESAGNKNKSLASSSKSYPLTISIEEENENTSNSESSVIRPINLLKKKKNLAVISSDDSSTEDEHDLAPNRCRSLRALSDYDTGDSSSKARPSFGKETNRQNKSSNDTDNFESDSGSENKLIARRLRKRGKRRPNYTTFFDSSDDETQHSKLRNLRKRTLSYSDSSDSECFTPSFKKRMKISTDNDSISSTSAEPFCHLRIPQNAIQPKRTGLKKSREETIINTESASTSNYLGQSTNRNNRSSVQAHRRRVNLSRSDVSETLTNNRQSPIQVQISINNSSITGSFRTQSDSESDSDNRIRPRALRRNRPFQSELSSSSDSEYSFNLLRRRITQNALSSSSSESDVSFIFSRRRITQNAVSSSSSESDVSFIFSRRRGNLHPITDSEEENENMTTVGEIKKEASMSKSQTDQTHFEYSSDSNGESEKCPICLIRFVLQEVGTPSSCDHSFCKQCIQEWAKSNNTCPVDRKTFNSLIIRKHLGGVVIGEEPVAPRPEVTVMSIFGSIGNVVLDFGVAYNVSESEAEDTFDYDGPEEICCICHSTDDDDADFIACDFCNNVYHMNCLNPPMRDLPVGDWHCPPCVQIEIESSENVFMYQIRDANSDV